MEGNFVMQFGSVGGGLWGGRKLGVGGKSRVGEWVIGSLDSM